MPFTHKTYHIPEPTPAFLFLMRECGYTQKQAQRILDKHRLMQNGRTIHKREIICGKVELSLFEAQDIEIVPLFYNDDFCVYDKPHNLLTHPKGRFHHFSLLDALRFRFGMRANILHRLDFQTSGLVLCSINPHTESALKALMSSKSIKKVYRAIVRGKLTHNIYINKPILTRHMAGDDLSIRSIISSKGKPSITILHPLHYFSNLQCTLIEAIPLTGRTHQIRLHCSHLGYPILGDPLYGASDIHTRIYLQARGKLEKERLKAYFGVAKLCLNAYCLHFTFQNEDFCFYSKQGFTLNNPTL